MRYLIGTDRLIDLLADDAIAQQLLTRLAGEGIAMSVISYLELYQGVLQSPDPVRTREKVEALLRVAPMLPFSREVAETCAAVRADLQRRGRRIRPRALDLQIAATAITDRLTLVTSNLHDYSDIPSLRLYQPA